MVVSAEKNFGNSHLFVFSSHHLSCSMEAVGCDYPIVCKALLLKEKSGHKVIKGFHNQVETRMEVLRKGQSQIERFSEFFSPQYSV